MGGGGGLAWDVAKSVINMGKFCKHTTEIVVKLLVLCYECAFWMDFL